MTTRDEVENLLRRWGYCFGESRPKDYDEDSSGSLLGSTANLLGGLHVGVDTCRPRRKTREFRDRDGVMRREIAPILLRHGHETRAHQKTWNPPPELMAVEQAAIELYHYHRLRGVVLRVEYCFRGMRHKERAAKVGESDGVNNLVTLRRYRGELTLAREWMAGRLHAGKYAPDC